MIYTFDLRTIGILVGISLMLAHILGIVQANSIDKWLCAFPRSRITGTVLLAIAAVWAFWLVVTMDLGEFTNYRMALEILVPVSYFLCLSFVDEFLSVRASGVLLLLLAEPVLEAAFLRHGSSRLLLSGLAYVWVIFGMFWVGMPYLMRDQIGWLLKSKRRRHTLCVAGAMYGFAVLISALFYHGQG